MRYARIIKGLRCFIHRQAPTPRPGETREGGGSGWVGAEIGADTGATAGARRLRAKNCNEK